MTQAELTFYTLVPSLLKAIADELKKQNEKLTAIAQKIDELDFNN